MYARKLIDAEDLKLFLHAAMKWEKFDGYESYDTVCSAIDKFPDFRTVGKPQWKRAKDTLLGWDTKYMCSFCYGIVDKPTKFCPNCGAQMG